MDANLMIMSLKTDKVKEGKIGIEAEISPLIENIPFIRQCLIDSLKEAIDRLEVM